MKQVIFNSTVLTEKGDIRPAARAAIKEQVLSQMENLGLAKNPNGGYSVVIGATEDGRPFYLTVDLTIGSADPFRAPKAKAKEAPAAVEVPDLFGE